LSYIYDVEKQLEIKKIFNLKDENNESPQLTNGFYGHQK
jgi:hypothetical protein